MNDSVVVNSQTIPINHGPSKDIIYPITNSPANTLSEGDEYLRLLALSAQITEITYSLSDIQTRIFEIQELRHQVVTDKNVEKSNLSQITTSAIDQSLVNLDIRLESVASAIRELETSFSGLPADLAITVHKSDPEHEISAIGRKREVMIEDWCTVQRDSDELRKELADDKWLVVFRTVTEQADNMMASLEKIVTQCQSFLWELQQSRGQQMPDPTGSSHISSSHRDHYLALSNNLEAKKTYYVPSVSKILSILDKGIREHTKNGECLRRHAESNARWRGLKERLTRVDTQMLNVRNNFAAGADGYASNSVSEDLPLSVDASPALSKQRSPSSLSLSRSMSPFRKLAMRMTGNVTPSRPPSSLTAVQFSDPTFDGHKRSRPSMNSRSPSERQTNRAWHLHSLSLASSPISNNSRSAPAQETPTKSKPKWNSSMNPTSITEGTTLKPKVKRILHPHRDLFSPPPDIPPVPPLPTRSISRSSVGSSRPWSPVASTSTISTISSSITRQSAVTRPTSRSSEYSSYVEHRARPKTPSQIPSPNHRSKRVVSLPLKSDSVESVTHISESLNDRGPRRPITPSRIPSPNAFLAIPNSDRPPFFSSRSSLGTQTPEATIRSRALQFPIHGISPTPRPNISRSVPSSYRSQSRLSISERVSSCTSEAATVAPYIADVRDAMDIEVAKTVNGIAHGMQFQKIETANRISSTDSSDLRAQYAVSNAFGRKILNCRLITVKKSSYDGTDATRKVMVRVGGGWLDLHMYLLNHQVS